MTKAEKSLHGVTYTNGNNAIQVTWDCQAINSCDALAQFYASYAASYDYEVFGLPVVIAVAKV